MRCRLTGSVAAEEDHWAPLTCVKCAGVCSVACGSRVAAMQRC
jgi:hypothetical protein